MLGNKFQWTFYFIQENYFEKAVCNVGWLCSSLKVQLAQMDIHAKFVTCSSDVSIYTQVYEVNIVGSGNDLVPSGNKPSEPMETQICFAIWHH